MEEYNDKICNFKNYAKQVLDLMVDAYKWKVMSQECNDPNMAQKYKMVSDTLFDLFMQEHNNIGNMFKE